MHPTRQFETAVCGGSNLKAPMKLDFLRSLCAQELRAGETLWQRDGATICADCFLPFAREELRPFEYILGEEMAE